MKASLSHIVFINGPCSTWLPWQKSIKKLVELDVTMNLKFRYY